VTIELSEEAAKWIAEKGYDEKFGARPLARVIQEYIKKPLADELLFGKLEHGGAVKVLVSGKGEDRALAFEYFPVDPAKRPKAKSEDDEDEDEDEPQAVLAEATPRKALPGPKDKKERGSKTTGTVPTVPRRKTD
jgi:ATP-dependent Clp protease ATP-binding subunit ClpA